MRILLATSEAAPFARTGDLADVSASLPAALAELGHEAAIILPAYRCVWDCGMPIEPLGIDFIVPIGSKTMTGRLLRSQLPGSPVPVYLVRQDEYFDRDGLYAQGGKDFVDNSERFVFFCRAVLEAIRLLDLDVDVIHANDWQTGLVPAYLGIEYQGLPRYQNVASLFTIHDIAYQGQFWHWDMLLTGLDWRYFNWHQMEFFGKLNFLKTGIVFADAVNAVSPRYAEEIKTPQFGAGLDGVLQYRSHVLTGVLHGIDRKAWNPATDPHLAANYTAETVRQGKTACKAAIQREVGLPQQANTPLAGFVGSLDGQKGADLLADLLPDWAGRVDLQWVLLGKGEPKLERRFRQLAATYPETFAAKLTTSVELAHRIAAGADMLVIPSRHEPCGILQMVGLRYGTVPVVRATGGLADTIVDANDRTLAEGTANGFSFRGEAPQALDEALHRAYDAYRRPDVWARLVDTGMRQDWSWKRSASEYLRVYRRTMDRRRQPVATEA